LFIQTKIQKKKNYFKIWYFQMQIFCLYPTVFLWMRTIRLLKNFPLVWFEIIKNIFLDFQYHIVCQRATASDIKMYKIKRKFLTATTTTEGNVKCGGGNSFYALKLFLKTLTSFNWETRNRQTEERHNDVCKALFRRCVPSKTLMYI